jgi:hypothetical protein
MSFEVKAQLLVLPDHHLNGCVLVTITKHNADCKITAGDMESQFRIQFRNVAQMENFPKTKHRLRKNSPVFINTATFP